MLRLWTNRSVRHDVYHTRLKGSEFFFLSTFFLLKVTPLVVFIFFVFTCAVLLTRTLSMRFSQRRFLTSMLVLYIYTKHQFAADSSIRLIIHSPVCRH